MATSNVVVALAADMLAAKEGRDADCGLHAGLNRTCKGFLLVLCFGKSDFKFLNDLIKGLRTCEVFDGQVGMYDGLIGIESLLDCLWIWDSHVGSGNFETE